MDNDLIQLWRIVAELSDQLSHNRAITVALQAQAGSVKSAASHQGTGFALRRFNMHLSQETFNSELERLNATVIAQNADLQHDNKQLAGLLKEYEQTLETVMNKFRTHAHAAQQHELAITRHYEALLLSRETSTLGTDLAASTAQSRALARISYLLRAALRAAGGELPPSDTDTETSDDADDWALERDCELSRLEHENRSLRRMLGIPVPADEEEDTAPPAAPHPAHSQLQMLDAPLVTRKYGRRSGSGSGSFIGGGELVMGASEGPFGSFWPVWQEGTQLGAGAGEVQQRDTEDRMADAFPRRWPSAPQFVNGATPSV